MKTRPAPLISAILISTSMVLLAAGCGQRPPIPPTPIPTLAPATLPVATPTDAMGAEAPTPVASAEVESGGTPDLVQAGAQVFEQTCSVCHNLTTETKVGPGLAGLLNRNQLPNGKPVNDENLQEWILGGGGAMPGMPLTDDQLAAVIAFLKEATQQ